MDAIIRQALQALDDAELKKAIAFLDTSLTYATWVELRAINDQLTMHLNIHDDIVRRIQSPSQG